MIKIYIHNLFSDGLLKKLTHNSSISKIDRKDDETNVYFNYSLFQFHFIFNPKINYNEDGMHLIDYYSIESNLGAYRNYLNFTDEDCIDESIIYKKIYEKIKDEKNWIVLVIRTEKLLTKIDMPELDFSTKDEYYLSKLSNHFIINDGFFLDDSIINKYKNFYFTFTNTVFQWNDYCGIYWYYDFGNIYKTINPKYDLAYCVRRIKGNRKELLKNLCMLNNDKLFLSITDYGGNDVTNINKHYDELKNFSIHFNSMKGNSDFSDVSYIPNFKCPGVDVFLRVLPKAKVQILDESWAHYKKDFKHIYISEKTIGLILAGIPFISTHPYPLDIIHSVLEIKNHPFYEQSKEYVLDAKNFTKFVKTFLDDFDKNYEICLEWSNLAKEKILEILESKNDLLELIINDKLKINKTQRLL